MNVTLTPPNIDGVSAPAATAASIRLAVAGWGVAIASKPIHR